jgi:putative membrane protein
MPSDPPHLPPPPPGDGADAGPAAPAAPAVDPGAFREARALHPASVVLGIPLRQLLQGILLPAVVGASTGPGIRVTLVLVGVILLLTLIGRVLAWRRFRFSFDGEVLRVDEGVLSRNHRALDVARIQQVEVERSLLARVFGLAALRVETAGASSDVEVDLRVMPEADAVALRQAVRASKAAIAGGGPVPPVDDPATGGADGEPAGTGGVAAADPAGHLLHVPPRRIVLAAVTGSRLLVLPAVLAAATQFLGDGGDNGVLDPETVLRGVLQLGIVVSVLLLIPASLLAATVAGLLRDFDWTLRRVDGDLHVRRGLISTRESVLPLHRVQLVEVQRNWLRRALGFASVRIHSAGGGGDDRRVTVPLLRDGEVDALLRQVLPGVPGVPHLTPHPPEARRRAVFRWTRDSLLLAVPLWAIPNLPGGLRVLGGVVVVAAAALGMVEYGQLASGRTDRVVAARRGALSVTTGLAPLVKLQAVSTTASWFQRRLGLATVRAHVAGPGGDLTVLDIGQDPGHELHRGLAVAAADPVVPAEVTHAPELTGAAGSGAGGDPG